MKRDVVNHKRALGQLALGLALLPSVALAELDSRFVVPPFVLNESVVDIGGWEMVYKDPHPVHIDPNMALLVDSPVLNASQPTALELKTMLKNPNVRFEDLGDRFVIEVQFAVSFEPRYSFDGPVNFRFGSTNEASPFHFGFHYGEDGGLYFQGRGGRVILLPKADMLQNAAYTFTVEVDARAGTFRVLVTSPGDDALRFESEEIPFQDGMSPSGKIAGFYLSNHFPSVISAYVDYVKITPR